MGISVGIVGCGLFAKGFIRLFRDHPLVDRVALCDTIPQRVKENLENFSLTEGYDSFDAICKSDLDALVIITQPWLHAPQVVQGMNAGKHVWSAVPLMKLPDGDKMLEWCDKIIQTSLRTGMQYFLAETSYYHPGTMFCRRKAAEGGFGEFVYAEGSYLHDLRAPTADLSFVAKHRWGDKWDDSKRGDIPMHYPTHSFSHFIGVTGSHVTKIACLGYEYPDDDWYSKGTYWDNTFCNEAAFMRMSNGMTARVNEFRRVAGPCFEGFSLYGTEGVYMEATKEYCLWAPKHATNTQQLSVEEMRDPLPDRKSVV